MAEHAAAQMQHDAAITLYKEALEYTPEEPTILLALAKLYLQVRGRNWYNGGRHEINIFAGLRYLYEDQIYNKGYIISYGKIFYGVLKYPRPV